MMFQSKTLQRNRFSTSVAPVQDCLWICSICKWFTEKCWKTLRSICAQRPCSPFPQLWSWLPWCILGWLDHDITLESSALRAMGNSVVSIYIHGTQPHPTPLMATDRVLDSGPLSATGCHDSTSQHININCLLLSATTCLMFLAFLLACNMVSIELSHHWSRVGGLANQSSGLALSHCLTAATCEAFRTAVWCVISEPIGSGWPFASHAFTWVAGGGQHVDSPGWFMVGFSGNNGGNL